VPKKYFYDDAGGSGARKRGDRRLQHFDLRPASTHLWDDMNEHDRIEIFKFVLLVLIAIWAVWQIIRLALDTWFHRHEMWRIMNKRCVTCGEPAAVRHSFWYPDGTGRKIYSPWCMKHEAKWRLKELRGED
jgi:hypothetical protein